MSLPHTWQEPHHLPGDPPGGPDLRLAPCTPPTGPAQAGSGPGGAYRGAGGVLGISEKQGSEERALPPWRWLHGASAFPGLLLGASQGLGGERKRKTLTFFSARDPAEHLTALLI